MTATIANEEACASPSPVMPAQRDRASIAAAEVSLPVVFLAPALRARSFARA
jgi:hypothetical protein